MPDYILADATAMHAEHPDTFELPDPQEVAALVPGSLAKLIFQPDGPERTAGRRMPERMWVEITAADGDNFTGTLANHPMTLSLRHGDTVRFTAANVIDVIPPGWSQQ